MRIQTSFSTALRSTIENESSRQCSTRSSAYNYAYATSVATIIGVLADMAMIHMRSDFRDQLIFSGGHSENATKSNHIESPLNKTVILRVVPTQATILLK